MQQKVWPHQNVAFRGPTVPAAYATVPGHPGSLENFGSSPSTRQQVWPFTHSYTAIERHGTVLHDPPECLGRVQALRSLRAMGQPSRGWTKGPQMHGAAKTNPPQDAGRGPNSL